MTRAAIIGAGHMGLSHAKALLDLGVEITSITNRSARHLPEALNRIPQSKTYQEALSQRPDLVVIATYPDSHAEIAIAAMEAGAHVFLEKPIATTVVGAERVVATARQTNKKLVIGYILRHHPSWQRFIAEARALGPPYVFRMNLNQQSHGAEWDTHRALMESASPIVDCGVHYVDVMCQITDAAPVKVQGIGLRLSDEISPDMYNYGQLQVRFEDGSVGWYEAGWGPMMSETAYFVKDVISPAGSVSIVDAETTDSADIDGHTKVGNLLVHRPDGDQRMALNDEPDHDALCRAEQAYVLRAIREDISLERHMHDSITSLAICLAADESIRTGQPVLLDREFKPLDR
ncbi:MAG: Gfo/Idh/MocA family oxidoreductase [Pseudomonadota bacterium]